MGVELSNIRAIASRDGELHAIPFQIDQKDSNNDWVWDSVTHISDANVVGRPSHDNQDPVNKRIFDANDVIVLMANDTGDKDRDGARKTAADRLVEVEVTDAIDNKKGWVYIAYFASDAPALSDVSYVHYDPKKHVVSAANHEFKSSSDHIMVLEGVKIEGATIIETNRIRGEVMAGIGPFPVNFDFNEKSFKGYTYGHIEGPVRIIRRSIEYVQLGLGISSPPAHCDHYHYPWHAETPILISKHPPIRKVSFLAASVLKSGTINRVNTGASWISLNGGRFSVANAIKIPREHKNHIDISPYLTNSDEIADSRNIKSFSEFEAGFEISTNEQTPDGDHIVHNLIVFSSNSESSSRSGHAIEMLENPLVLKALTLER